MNNNYYNVTFTSDWASVITTVSAPNGEAAIENARDQLSQNSDLPWNPSNWKHVEVEYVGPCV